MESIKRPLTAREFLQQSGVEVSLDDYRSLEEIARAFGHVQLVGANQPAPHTVPDKTEV